MLYAITHRTIYRYETPAAFSHHLAHLRPRETPQQRVLDCTLDVVPAPTHLAPRLDYFGNEAVFLSLEAPHGNLTVTARSHVRVSAEPLPTDASTPPWEKVRDACAHDRLDADSQAGEFAFESVYVPVSRVFADYAAESFPSGQSLLAGLRHFTARIFHDFRFDSRATTISTPVHEVFRKRRGVCQDFAHFGIACLRSLGLPARYVSGYLETLPPPGKPRLIGADASHAWFSVWCSGLGWVDADPTNNVLPGERHVTVAWGRDYGDVSPLRGVVVGGGEHRLAVSVDVARVNESLP